MVDETGRVGGRKAIATAKGRPRTTAKDSPASVAAEPVLPPVPAEPAVPAILAAVAPSEPAPVVEQPVAEQPDPETAMPDATVPDTAAEASSADHSYEPAAPAASLEVKETNMNETVTSFAEKAQEQTKTAFANVGEQTRGAVEKSRKVAEDMAEFGKGNVEAMVESARIAAQAIESMGQEAATFARARYDSTAQMIQTLASVKSPTEALQIQADYFRASLDALVKEASRSTEATLKLAGDVAKPLQNRMAVAGDKFRATV